MSLTGPPADACSTFPWLSSFGGGHIGPSLRNGPGFLVLDVPVGSVLGPPQSDQAPGRLGFTGPAKVWASLLSTSSPPPQPTLPPHPISRCHSPRRYTPASLRPLRPTRLVRAAIPPRPPCVPTVAHPVRAVESPSRSGVGGRGAGRGAQGLPARPSGARASGEGRRLGNGMAARPRQGSESTVSNNGCSARVCVGRARRWRVELGCLGRLGLSSPGLSGTFGAADQAAKAPPRLTCYGGLAVWMPSWWTQSIAPDGSRPPASRACPRVQRCVGGGLVGGPQSGRDGLCGRTRAGEGVGRRGQRVVGKDVDWVGWVGEGWTTCRPCGMRVDRRPLEV